jgi:hypothetical protein
MQGVSASEWWSSNKRIRLTLAFPFGISMHVLCSDPTTTTAFHRMTLQNTALWSRAAFRRVTLKEGVGKRVKVNWSSTRFRSASFSTSDDSNKLVCLYTSISQLLPQPPIFPSHPTSKTESTICQSPLFRLSITTLSYLNPR